MVAFLRGGVGAAASSPDPLADRRQSDEEVHLIGKLKSLRADVRSSKVDRVGMIKDGILGGGGGGGDDRGHWSASPRGQYGRRRKKGTNDGGGGQPQRRSYVQIDRFSDEEGDAMDGWGLSSRSELGNGFAYEGKPPRAHGDSGETEWVRNGKSKGRGSVGSSQCQGSVLPQHYHPQSRLEASDRSEKLALMISEEPLRPPSSSGYGGYGDGVDRSWRSFDDRSRRSRGRSLRSGGGSHVGTVDACDASCDRRGKGRRSRERDEGAAARRDAWLASATSQLVCVASAASASSHRYAAGGDTSRSSGEAAILALFSASFVLSLGTGTGYLHAPFRRWLTSYEEGGYGSALTRLREVATVEQLLSVLLFALASVVSGLVLWPDYQAGGSYYAVAGGEIWNVTLFCASWVGLYLAARNAAEAVFGGLAPWFVVAFSGACASASLLVEKTGPACEGQALGGSELCESALIAGLLGVASAVISLLCGIRLLRSSWMDRKYGVYGGHSTGWIDILSSTILLFVNSALVAIASAPSGPASEVGSAFLTSWATWILGLGLWKGRVEAILDPGKRDEDYEPPLILPLTEQTARSPESFKRSFLSHGDGTHGTHATSDSRIGRDYERGDSGGTGGSESTPSPSVMLRCLDSMSQSHAEDPDDDLGKVPPVGPDPEEEQIEEVEYVALDDSVGDSSRMRSVGTGLPASPRASEAKEQDPGGRKGSMLDAAKSDHRNIYASAGEPSGKRDPKKPDGEQQPEGLRGSILGFMSWLDDSPRRASLASGSASDVDQEWEFESSKPQHQQQQPQQQQAPPAARDKARRRSSRDSLVTDLSPLHKASKESTTSLESRATKDRSTKGSGKTGSKGSRGKAPVPPPPPMRPGMRGSTSSTSIPSTVKSGLTTVPATLGAPSGDVEFDGNVQNVMRNSANSGPGATTALTSAMRDGEGQADAHSDTVSSSSSDFDILVPDGSDTVVTDLTPATYDTSLGSGNSSARAAVTRREAADHARRLAGKRGGTKTRPRQPEQPSSRGLPSRMPLYNAGDASSSQSPGSKRGQGDLHMSADAFLSDAMQHANMSRSQRNLVEDLASPIPEADEEGDSSAEDGRRRHGGRRGNREGGRRAKSSGRKKGKSKERHRSSKSSSKSRERRRKKGEAPKQTSLHESDLELGKEVPPNAKSSPSALVRSILAESSQLLKSSRKESMQSLFSDEDRTFSPPGEGFAC